MFNEETQNVSESLASVSGSYQQHKPEETDLYKIIEQNLPSFQSHLSTADISLPRFVHEEFRKYLRCGLLEHGFLRVKCDDCSPKPAELKALLDRIIKRVIRRLERDGLLILDEEQLSLDFNFDEPIDAVSAASIRYRIAIGPHSGSRTLTLHDPTLVRTDKPVKALTADRDGFSLNAAVACQHYQRERLERSCRRQDPC